MQLRRWGPTPRPEPQAGPAECGRGTSTAGGGPAPAGTISCGPLCLVGLASAPPGHRPALPLPSSHARSSPAPVRRAD